MLGDPARDVGLVLAAGAATRFGSPKQLAEFRGAPLLSWPIRALRRGGLEQVIVVLGAHAERIAAAAAVTDPAAETVSAADWSEGLSASLKAGVTAAVTRHQAERVLIALADQPLLRAEAVAGVLAASRAGAAIARASYGGTPGHPVALSRDTFSAVNQLTGDAGARRLTGFSIVDVPCDGLGSPADIDTPADLARWST